jgi:His-Xaa-Ser system radical SAM maturase HxsC
MCPQQKDISTIGTISTLIARNIDYSVIRQVYITGGEPFFASSILEEIMRLIPNKVEVSILTNGTLGILDTTFFLRDRLRFCIPLYASISDIHNCIVGYSGFYKTVTNLLNLANNGIMIELRNVITRANYRNLPLFAHYVYNNLPFVANVAFMGLEVMAGAKDNINMLWVDPSEYAELLLESVSYLEENGIQCNLFNMPLCTIPLQIRQSYVASISPWKRSYSRKCIGCEKKNYCCGAFFSSLAHYEESIEPILSC